MPSKIAKYRLIAILFNHYLGFSIAERIKVHKKFLSDPKGLEILTGFKVFNNIEEHLIALNDLREIWFRAHDIDCPYRHFLLFVENSEEFLSEVIDTAPREIQKQILYTIGEESRSLENCKKAVLKFKVKIDENDAMTLEDGEEDYEGNIFDLNESYEM